MRIETFAEGDVPAGLRARAGALREQAWPGGGPHDPALKPVAMLLVSPEGEVLAALDILSKEIAHAGRRYRAAGLSAVVTDAAHRGEGHGRRLVAAARATVGASGADVALFTCDRPLRGFYERAGWSVLEGTVLIGGTPADPFPSDRPGFDKVTLGAFLTARAQRDAAAFRHSRVGLYPGETDRLW
ncbi:GNAT family N-acetyltransferase [Streptomyces sp. ISL-11]|uniref:GNAT family N-acetyltransferase n=1 Tax=Streptomyces sp. ISL-11 TaxID=2819174 RepID=UPI001BE559FC|nr:GNAT family N-acetyltransferase [Streptomyces sp. ISL-11]MBT2382283.1 GNAT family N-acetyltransferase [Streptomyces sp. ISL-11]